MPLSGHAEVQQGTLSAACNADASAGALVRRALDQRHRLFRSNETGVIFWYSAQKTCNVTLSSATSPMWGKTAVKKTLCTGVNRPEQEPVVPWTCASHIGSFLPEPLKRAFGLCWRTRRCALGSATACLSVIAVLGYYDGGNALG